MSLYAKHQSKRRTIREQLLDACRDQITETVEKGGKAADSYSIAVNVTESELSEIKNALEDLRAEFDTEPTLDEQIADKPDNDGTYCPDCNAIIDGAMQCECGWDFASEQVPG